MKEEHIVVLSYKNKILESWCKFKYFDNTQEGQQRVRDAEASSAYDVFNDHKLPSLSYKSAKKSNIIYNDI